MARAHRLFLPVIVVFGPSGSRWWNVSRQQVLMTHRCVVGLCGLPSRLFQGKLNLRSSPEPSRAQGRAPAQGALGTFRKR